MAGKLLNLNGDELQSGNGTLWLKVIYLYGIPGAICLFLVYLLAVNVPSAIADVSKSVAAIREAQAKDHRDQTYYLRAICLNLSKDETQRALCSAPSEK
jgi:hypothetical protein